MIHSPLIIDHYCSETSQICQRLGVVPQESLRCKYGKGRSQKSDNIIIWLKKLIKVRYKLKRLLSMKSNNHNEIQIYWNFLLVPFVAALAAILKTFFFSFSACFWTLRTSCGTVGSFPAGDPTNGATTRPDYIRSRCCSCTKNFIINLLDKLKIKI